MSLLNCGQVVQYEKNEESVSSSNLKDMPTDLLHMIAEYLKNPFYNLGTLNCCYFRDLVSTFSVKPFLGRYLDIPELLTDDGPEIEKELKLLFPLDKFSNPKHFYKLSFEARGKVKIHDIHVHGIVNGIHGIHGYNAL